MIVHKIDPLTDPRWEEFLNRHPDASAFHSAPWLDALRISYGFKPLVFTTSSGPELDNALVFCEVSSWLTGRRLVSVPFADHCQPLADGHDLKIILEHLVHDGGEQGWKYIELRPQSGDILSDVGADWENSESFTFHKVDLRKDLDAVYRGFHESCVRRKIKRAEREKLTYEAGRSEDLLEKFQRLLLLTRRRHKLPPQPAIWFHSLASCLGANMTVHVASKDSRPVASMITLSHKKSVIYKYGCSDGEFHNLGGIPFLFWKVIQQGKATGVEDLDLGRSAPDDPGLNAFKEHLGAVASELRYYRSPRNRAKESLSAQRTAWARNALARLPDPLLTGTGRLLYRHLG